MAEPPARPFGTDLAPWWQGGMAWLRRTRKPKGRETSGEDSFLGEGRSGRRPQLDRRRRASRIIAALGK